ncbi:MAG: class I SAM-dependent methyltransferase [Planctomycetota bacterium]|nr:class I SAM-dependent methyltransferase [Planctomycetota bacterium]
MSDAQSPFDPFQPYYDLLVNWEHRLALEGPFFQKVFHSVSARRVLDCACGTGHHVRMFARWGVEAVGADLAPSMVEQARADSRAEGAHIRFEVADFRELPLKFPEPFQAVICTGNSLPLAGSPEGLRAAVKSMYDVLAPGGVVILHTLNYAMIPEGGNVYEGPRVRQVEDREILFLKVFRKVRRQCDIDLVVLEKQAGAWKRIETHVKAWAVEHAELESMVTGAGFVRLQCYGGYEPKPFDPADSHDLIVVARKEKAAK